MRKKERRWTHLTIKLYLSHFSRLDRPKILHFCHLKMVSEKFLLSSLFNFMHLCTWTSSQEQESNCQKHCEETVFFLSFPANIFRPRIFENKSKLLSANIIWTSESSDFFFPSLSQSEPNYELRKQNRGILFQKLFPVLHTVSAGLQISGTSCLYFEH